jgi:diguanylate cyclase (GGDEF)-like protein/PAS domain S-box-containing protein
VLYLRKAADTLAGEPDEYLAKMINQGKVETKVVQLPDGRMISVTNAPVPEGGWVSTHEDITESKRREASFRLLFESNPLPMWVFDVETLRFLAVNDAAVAHYGFSREQFLAMTIAEIRPLEERERLMQFVRGTGTQQGEEIWRHRKADGTEIEVAIHSRHLRYEGRASTLVAIRDVTEQRRAEMERARYEEQIVHLAHHDALTELPNRALFCKKLDQALTRVTGGERLAVLYLDLDRFKHVNDTLGHPIGDQLLKTVADRLCGCAREGNSVARLGGDEFAVIQTSLGEPSDAAALARRICEAVKAPYLIEGHQVVVDVSIGIALAPDDATDRDELLKNADVALYGAKAAGRDTYCFFEAGMKESVKARHDLERDLQTALAKGEFELLYQPIVNLRANAISAFEALLRWHHPVRGVISPSEFIPIAEESGLINSLGDWVLRTACAEAATWPDNIKIVVNLSPAQLRSNNLVPAVISTLAASGLPARRLDFEITESVLMQKTASTLDTLHQLRELGVRIAMDDFGMGYSSLSYLLSFPFDKIKIDYSFIKGLPDAANSVAIVRAVASLASSLNMTTVAEGVETEQQLEMVIALGCTEMQGHVFSPPRPAAEISRLFLAPAESVANVA